MNILSVCMIVKNESSVLDRCLAQVKKFADQIVVVDTGSSDCTKQIAKKYTKNVFDFVWQNDFSLARNYAISKAKTKYVMWLDADDYIDDDNVKKINLLKNSAKSDTFMLKYQILFDKSGKCLFEYYRERILKNCDKCKFCGFVHEAISPFGKIEYTDIAVKHLKIEKTRDEKRNLKLYNYHKKLGYIFNSREQFYYARELFYNKYYKKSIKMFKKFLKMDNKFWPNIIDAHIMLADAFVMVGDLKKAGDCLVDCIKNYQPNPVVCTKLGIINLSKKQYKNAIFWLKSALILPKDEKSGQFIENDYYDFLPYLELSICYFYIGDYQNFKKYHNLAKQIKPYDGAVLFNQKFVKD